MNKQLRPRLEGGYLNLSGSTTEHYSFLCVFFTQEAVWRGVFLIKFSAFTSVSGLFNNNSTISAFPFCNWNMNMKKLIYILCVCIHTRYVKYILSHWEGGGDVQKTLPPPSLPSTFFLLYFYNYIIQTCTLFFWLKLYNKDRFYS